MARYPDRRQAGLRLAEVLAPALEGFPDPVVLGIPRGGVVVGAAVAEALDLPLDVVVVEKVGMPWNPELAVGAVGEGEALWIDERLAGQLDPQVLDAAIGRERLQVEEKLRGFRAVRPREPLGGRTAVVVDDGVATGSTVRAALLALRPAGPARRVLAVPVGPPETLEALEQEADLVVCPMRPEAFYAVGQWYDSFGQVSQEEAVEVLRRRAQPTVRPTEGPPEGGA